MKNAERGVDAQERCIAQLEAVASRLDREPDLAKAHGMTVQDIRERLHGGFVPFKIRTSDGAEFQVPHKEFIYLTAKRVVIATGEGYVNVLDPLHIVSIEESKSLPTG